jgi:hypothetical protein
MNPTFLHHATAQAHFDELARTAARRGPRQRLRRLLRQA